MGLMTQKRTDRGTFRSLPVEKQMALREAFVNGQYHSLIGIAKGLGITKGTVITYRDKWMDCGQLSEKNWFAKKSRTFRPTVLQRLHERHKAMSEYVASAAKSGDRVSANELQRLFGGEKELASKVLKEISASLAKRRKPVLVLRRTVRDQPYGRRKR